jgi:HSP20 family molecular chaperone IbpA
MEFVVRTRLGAFSPNADVVVDEEERRIVAVIEIAGADPQAFRIEFDGRNLTIAGRRREAVCFGHGSFAQKEIAQGEFFKRIALPLAVEPEGITASYADGLLVVVAPIAAMAYMPTARTEMHVIVKRIHP